MANVTSEFKYAFLLRIQRAALKTWRSLADVIGQLIDETGSGIETGAVLIASAGNGSSVTFQLSSELHPKDIFELCGELHKRHAAAKAALIKGDVDNGVAAIPAPNDSQIATEMLSKMESISEVSPDFSGCMA